MSDLSLQAFLDRAENLCRERGVRLTTQRRQVLALVHAANKPVSAYDLLEKLRETLKNPTPPTVYRALDFLREQGLVHKIESLHAYIGCDHPEHIHSSQFLICQDCGDVRELSNPELDQSLQEASRAFGFQTSHPVVELLGNCADCSAMADSEKNPPSSPLTTPPGDNKP